MSRLEKRFRRALSLLAPFALAGCTTAYLSPEGGQVRVLRERPEGCQLEGTVKVQGSYFPNAETMEGYLRNEAAEKYGANVVVVTDSDNASLLYTKKGDVYSCADPKAATEPKPQESDWFVMLEAGSGLSNYQGSQNGSLAAFSGFRSLSGFNLQASAAFYLNLSREKNLLLGASVTPNLDFSGANLGTTTSNLQTAIFGASLIKHYGDRQVRGPYLRGDGGLELGQIYAGNHQLDSSLGLGVMGEAGYSFGHALAYLRLHEGYVLGTLLSQLGFGLGLMY